MRPRYGRVLALLVALLPLASSGTTVAQETTPLADDLAPMLPTRVGEERIFPMPTELASQLTGIFDFAALDREDGIDADEFSIAGVLNYDVGGLMSAKAQGTLSEADVDAFRRWGTEEMLTMVALQFEGIPADELLDSFFSLDPELASSWSDEVVEGRRVLVDLPTDTDSWAWGFIYPSDDMIFLVISVSPEPDMLQALAALP